MYADVAFDLQLLVQVWGAHGDREVRAFGQDAVEQASRCKLGFGKITFHRAKNPLAASAYDRLLCEALPLIQPLVSYQL